MSTTKVPDALRDVTVVDAAKITTGTIPEARITTLASTKLTGTVADARFPATLPASSGANLTALPAANLTGTIADARISASSVNAHVDLTAVRQDIAMLALYNAVSDNRAAYNLPFSFIDQFEDDTGITTETTVDRDSSGEYVSSVTETVSGHTVTKTGNITRSSTQAKFGTYSAYFDGNGSTSLFIADSTDWDFGTNPFTLECWVYGASGNDANFMVFPDNLYKLTMGYISSTTAYTYISSNGSGWDITNNITAGTNINAASWKHYALTRDGADNRISFFQDGVRIGYSDSSASINTGVGITFGKRSAVSMTGYMDEVRISNSCRYPSGTTFTPHASVHVADANTKLLMHMEDANLIDESTVTTNVSATGTLISDTQTSSVATTKMSGVILYKDNAGTATLGTDLKIYLSANGGTNYTEVVAADYGTVTPLFSTGVKMVRLAEQTVTSGTTPVMKAVWANQASGSKETQLHGWAMNY